MIKTNKNFWSFCQGGNEHSQNSVYFDVHDQNVKKVN